MEYALESEREYDRLNRQSRTAGYDFRAELAAMVESYQSRQPKRILDAGCGSGIVTAYLRELFPNSEIHACDRAAERLERAAVDHESSRIFFQQEALDALSYPDGHFDLVVCRYVIQHLSEADRARVLHQLHRVISPGGHLYLIDADGMFFNLYPMSESLTALVQRAFTSEQFDLHVGRKLPSLLHKIGFERIGWEIDAMNYRGELMFTELTLTRERFEQAEGFLTTIMGSPEDVARLKQEYLAAMVAPGAVMFVNKFYVSGFKPQA